MATESDDQQGLILGLVFGVIALVISLVIGIALHRTGSGTQAPAGTVMLAPAAASGAQAAAGQNGVAGAVPPAEDVASVRVEAGVVKFYFATGKAELAAGAAEALADVVKGVAAGKKAVVSGFHDSTGDAERNAELARQRAFAVRDALVALGIGEDKMELRKPEATTGSGSDAQARRVEVTLE